MLQPRILAKRSTSTCQCLSAPFRSYATAVDAPPKSPIRATTTTDAISFAPQGLMPRQQGGFQLKTYKPRTPGTRWLRRPINDHLWKGRPIKALTFPKTGHGKGGRNNTGRVTVRHRGGGHKRRIRMIDFKRAAAGPHTVERIEYDPNRSAHIALMKNEKTGEQSYIVAAEGMRAGDVVQSYMSGVTAELVKSMGGVMDPGMLAAKTAFRGNCLPLKMVPIGTQIYNIGSAPGKGGVYCRSAGTFATVVAKEESGKKIKDVVVRLQSGEVRRLDKDCCATVGVASNPHHHFRQLGKAGRSRWLGIRPTVRGVAMNAADHPHGGGRGKSKGNVHPVSPWGTPAKGGFKTRKKRNPNKAVVKERERNQGKRRNKSS